MVIDTNILVYAAEADSEFHADCLKLLEDSRIDPSPNYLTWGICYEFIRIASHPRVLRNPWTSQNAVRFIDELLASHGFSVLAGTDRHLDVLSLTLAELPGIRGSIMHDVHTAVLMRENGIREVCTLDTDFYRFPFLTVVDPLR